MNKDPEPYESRKDSGHESLFGWRERTVRLAWTLFFLVVLFVLFLLLMWRAVPVLLLMFAGALVALALRFVSDNFSCFTRIPPLWSLTLVLFLLVGASIIGGMMATPIIADQFRELGQNLQQSIFDLERRYATRRPANGLSNISRDSGRKRRTWARSGPKWPACLPPHSGQLRDFF